MLNDQMTKLELIDMVLEQIENDVNAGDLTAIEVLLNAVPETALKSFLSEGPY